MAQPTSTRQRQLRNPLRARVARLTQLGLIEGMVAPAGSTLVTFRTPEGDTWTGPEGHADTYLTGLAHGAWLSPEHRMRMLRARTYLAADEAMGVRH